MIRNGLNKRLISTLIPPKIISSNQIGNVNDAKRVQKMIKFYQNLPQGPLTKESNNTNNNNNTNKSLRFIEWYRKKYFEGDNASGKPILHFSIAIILFGYCTEYYFHLRHKKEHK